MQHRWESVEPSLSSFTCAKRPNERGEYFGGFVGYS